MQIGVGINLVKMGVLGGDAGVALGVGGGAPSYDAASIAFFDAMTTPPSDDAKAAVDALVVGLKADAIWDSLDVLWPMAMETEQAGRLNLKSPGTFTHTAVNTPTFTAKFGWAGNGTTSYLNTGWDAATNGVQFTQNSASLGCWIDAGTDTPSGSASAMGAIDFLGNGSVLFPWGSANSAVGNVNNNQKLATLPVNTRYGFTVFERTSSTVVDGYKNGEILSGSPASVVSGARISVDFFVGATNHQFFEGAAQFSNNRISCVFMGASLGSTKQAALYTRLNTFRTAMAAIP